jgi:hypothetical protein
MDHYSFVEYVMELVENHQMDHHSFVVLVHHQMVHYSFGMMELVAVLEFVVEHQMNFQSFADHMLNLTMKQQMYL